MCRYFTILSTESIKTQPFGLGQPEPETNALTWFVVEVGFYVFKIHDTPWKFNIAPENAWLEDQFPFGIPYFQGLC